MTAKPSSKTFRGDSGSSTDNIGGHGASIKSWIACLIIVVGFLLGGAAMILWNWPMFWAGVAVVVVGSIVARAVQNKEDGREYGGQSRGGHGPEGDLLTRRRGRDRV